MKSSFWPECSSRPSSLLHLRARPSTRSTHPRSRPLAAQTPRRDPAQHRAQPGSVPPAPTHHQAAHALARPKTRARGQRPAERSPSARADDRRAPPVIPHLTSIPLLFFPSAPAHGDDTALAF